ncbi:MAG: DivIVA domain-containing protein [Streptococcaceae bacterium]|jgi:cell division initiation protein|nr:DivIVA domain-containing protein [Streptococcaceae bacterium]
MALSPLDIQNKIFGTRMRGYNQDEVDDFLDQVVHDYELLKQKNHELEKSLKHSKEKLEYFNKLKDALNKSIIVAQDTADKVKATANDQANVIVKSAEQEANTQRTAAQVKAKQIVEEATQKAEKILFKATEDANKLRIDTDELKKKARFFHQQLILMMESQLQTVKSKEWDELLMPLTTALPSSNELLRDILENSNNDDNFLEFENNLKEASGIDNFANEKHEETLNIDFNGEVELPVE